MSLEKKVLITGGAGFIGKRLSLNLCKKDFKVCIVDNLHHQIPSTSKELHLLHRWQPPDQK